MLKSAIKEAVALINNYIKDHVEIMIGNKINGLYNYSTFYPNFTSSWDR